VPKNEDKRHCDSQSGNCQLIRSRLFMAKATYIGVYISWYIYNIFFYSACSRHNDLGAQLSRVGGIMLWKIV
jgi:hypothetical protein